MTLVRCEIRGGKCEQEMWIDRECFSICSASFFHKLWKWILSGNIGFVTNWTVMNTLEWELRDQTLSMHWDPDMECPPRVLIKMRALMRKFLYLIKTNDEHTKASAVYSHSYISANASHTGKLWMQRWWVRSSVSWRNLLQNVKRFWLYILWEWSQAKRGVIDV